VRVKIAVPMIVVGLVIAVFIAVFIAVPMIAVPMIAVPMIAVFIAVPMIVVVLTEGQRINKGCDLENGYAICLNIFHSVQDALF
jgi:hypothetical protein